MNDLAKELAKIENQIQGIEEQPPTMDYLVEYCQVTREYERLIRRRDEIKALLA